MALQARQLSTFVVFAGAAQETIDHRVYNNIEYLIGSGSVSLGSVRGSLDSLTVHSGHEFRVWPSDGLTRRPVVCRFKKAMLPEVVHHITTDIEVYGMLRRNARGEPILMNVDSFRALEPAGKPLPIKQLSGLIDDLYDGASLRDYMENLRDG